MTPAMQRTGMIAAGMTVLVLMLAGCQSVSPSRHPKLPPPDARELQQQAEKQCRTPPAGMSQQDCHYYAQMQYGIRRNFYDADHYRGRECTLTISWGRHGRYNVLSTSGDEVLCKKAWGVVSSADYLPPPPKHIPGKIMIDFRPG
ncbi:cell envelope integrity TolA C-terminal domain-containing protein [Pantoea sp. B65]|uniref:cell envelope integrity TolA C-terminal domain-containing protein n=1 Tax=Pantoea sp. B65 TaxID=2813359 RepID=UPI0039B51384